MEGVDPLGGLDVQVEPAVDAALAEVHRVVVVPFDQWAELAKIVRELGWVDRRILPAGQPSIR